MRVKSRRKCLCFVQQIHEQPNMLSSCTPMADDRQQTAYRVAAAVAVAVVVVDKSRKIIIIVLVLVAFKWALR